MKHELRMGTCPRGTGLVALNVVLLAVLGVVSIVPGLEAQSMRGSPQVPRVRGEYAVVGGQTMGDTASTIYVLDSANRELVSLRWNESTKSIEGVGFRDLVRDANSDPDR